MATTTATGAANMKSVHTHGGAAPTCRKCHKVIANDQQATFSPNLPGPAAARWSHNVCPVQA